MKRILSAVSMAAAIVLTATCAQAGLSENRDTPEIQIGLTWLYQGSNVIYAGSMVAVNSSGQAAPADDASGYNVVGRAEEYSDNTGANYAQTNIIKVKRGIFRWKNGDSITAADIGSLAYVSNDETVVVSASPLTYNIIAGVIANVDGDGVWVDTHDIGAQGAVSAASLTTTGNGTIGGNLTVTTNATVGGTLAVTGASTLTGAVTARGAINANTMAATGTVAGVNSTWSGTVGVSTNGRLAVVKVEGSATNGLAYIDAASTVTNFIDRDINL